MNLYLVVSEDLEGHPSEGLYRIAELVVACSRSEAAYLAWKNDDGLWGSFTGDLRDKPKFQSRLKARGLDGLQRIVSDEYQDDGVWCL